MKPFDLEAAKRGEPIITRDGVEAHFVAHTDADGFAERYPHVWLGATVVNQEEADRDIPKLLALPAGDHCGDAAFRPSPPRPVSAARAAS